MQQGPGGIAVGTESSVSKSRQPSSTSRWKLSAAALQKEVLTIWFVLRNRRTPWYSKIIAGTAVAYLLSPIQIIPSFIPVIGLMDDVLVLTLGMALIRRLTPDELVDEGRRKAMAAMARGENIRPAAARRITLLAATSWLILSAFLLWLLWRR
jgi:uncharacterized membrane protein YkvA (DUF1232 family)